MFTFFTPKFYLSCILNITSLGFIFAEEQLLEPMVVVESRTPQSLNETSPWVTRISVYELEERQIDNLADALRSVPGMAVFRSGQAGSQTSLFSRGANSDHTTFLYEGRKLNGGFSGTYNLGQIPLTGASSVEVLRGSSSVQYGAEGIGGAIMLRNEPLMKKVNWKMEVGSNHSINGAVDYEFSEFGWEGRIGTAIKTTENEQPFSQFDNQSAFFTFSRKLSENLEIDLLGTGFKSEVNYPGNTKSFSYPAKDQQMDVQNLLVSPGMKLNLGEWKISAFYSYSDDELGNKNSFSDSTYNAYTNLLEFLINGEIYERVTLTAGGSYEENNFFKISNTTNLTEVDEDPDTKSIFVLTTISLGENTSISLGGRADEFSAYGGESTFSTSFEHLITDGFKFSARFATSFSPPQANDLYGIYGEPSLNPEKAESWETGLILQPNEWFNFRITYFETDFEDLIDWDNSASSMSNINLASSNGFESSVETAMGNFTSNLSFSYLDAKDSVSNQRLVRRPRIFGNLILQHSSQSNTLGAGLTWSDDVIDIDGGNFLKIKGDDYIVLRLFGNHHINDEISVFGRIENLLDKKYDEVDGYPALGRGFYAGLKFSF